MPPFTVISGYNPVYSAGSRLFPIALASVGRVAFLIDYSELSAPGVHTFYVERYHGTVGAISVDWTSSGDAHTTASGTLSWASGQAGFQFFQVTVPVKSVNGDHRITVTLSNPVGGIVISHGGAAYGVIDDGTIAPDTDAVFYDSAAGAGGTGSQASPYNSIYTALANVGSKRYLYAKGTTTVDNTQTVNPNGGGGIVGCMYIPTGRVSEATRLHIQKWPGFTWTVTGGSATDKIGFYSDGPGGATVGDSSYVTFRGIDFSSLNSSGATYAEGGGIGYFKNRCNRVNAEFCTGDNINGSTNTSLFNMYHLFASKMWRCTSNNIQVNGSNTNQNAGGLCTYYKATDLSYGRCKATLSASSFYFKGLDAGTTMPKVAFCIMDTPISIDCGFNSSSNYANYMVVTDNEMKNATNFNAVYNRGNAASANGKYCIARNVFNNCGASSEGAIYFHDSYDWQMFDNIHYLGAKAWDDFKTAAASTNPARNGVEYADYNHTYNMSSSPYKYLAVSYANAAAVNAVNALLCGNDTAGDPLFVNTVTGDYSFPNTSPCYQSGLGGFDKGPTNLVPRGP